MANLNILKEKAKAQNILEVIESRIQLKPSGGSYKGLCPFHDEKTPSFFVVPEKGFYKCHGCGEGGDIIKFIQEYENLSFKLAIELITGEKIDTDYSIIQTPYLPTRIKYPEALRLMRERDCTLLNNLLKNHPTREEMMTYLHHHFKSSPNQKTIYLSRDKIRKLENNAQYFLTILKRSYHDPNP